MITIHELTRRFQIGRAQILAVDRLSFVVPAGEVYGLLGPNGAGKTTTIRMIVGLLRPDSGYAEVAGFRTSECAGRGEDRGLDWFLRMTACIPWLSVREMLLFFADLYGLSPAEGSRQPANAGRFVRADIAARPSLRAA